MNETYEDIFESMYKFRPTKIVKRKPPGNPNEGKYVYSVDYLFSDRLYCITEAMVDGRTAAVMLELPTGVTLPHRRHVDAELCIVERERNGNGH